MDLHSKHDDNVLGQFQYSPLDHAKREIRLVQIQPALNEGAIIRLQIKHVDLDSYMDAVEQRQTDLATFTWHRPSSADTDQVQTVQAATAPSVETTAMLEFVALSYTWGPETPTYDIILESRESRGRFAIRQNLFDFLEVRRHERATDSATSDLPWFWIDQLCINQDNMEEKSYQVNQMSEIYSFATSVEVWLGAGFSGSDECMDMLNALPIDSYFQPNRDSSLLTKFDQNSQISNHKAALLKIWTLEYWYRSWILQEVHLGNIGTYRLGNRTSHGPRSFFRKLLWLFSALLNPTGGVNPELERRSKWFYNASHIGALNWGEVGDLVEGSICSDARDMAYCVMGMVMPSLRFYPDYSLDTAEVLFHILRAEANALFYGERASEGHLVELAIQWLKILDHCDIPDEPREHRRFVRGIIYPILRKQKIISQRRWWLRRFSIWQLFHP